MRRKFNKMKTIIEQVCALIRIISISIHYSSLAKNHGFLKLI